MAESRTSTFGALLKPKLVRVGLAIFAALAAYDTLSSQLELPTVRRWWGMSGSLLPWWGWLLILQAIFVYALFEYVRRLSPAASQTTQGDELPVLDYTEMDQVRGQVTALTEKAAEREENFLVRLGTVDRDLRNLLDGVDDRLGELAGQLEQIVKLDLRADKVTQQEIEAASAAAKGARAYAEGTNVAFGEEIQAVSRRVIQVIDAQDEFQANMEAWVGKLRDDVERRFEWVDQGIAAILDRERLLGLAASIEAVGDELSGPTRGEPPGDWDAWLAKYGGWKRNVEAWSRIGAIYRDGVIERVHDTPHSEYRGKWVATDDLFPDSVAVHDYKTFRIVLRNFYVEREPVDNCVRMAAFARPSMKGRGSTPRDEQQMPRPPKV